jgi:lysozyme
MTYLNSHARTTGPTKNDQFQQLGRTPSLFGVYMGYIKNAQDVQKNGRLQVWIPEFGSAPDNSEGWIIANYCSPFAGATNNETTSQANVQSFEGTQTSYGMWMVPPDINNIVAVMFLNGDPSRAIWIGCLFNQYMNNMVPAMAAGNTNYQYNGTYVPVAEYNKWDTRVTQPDTATKPYEKTKFQGLGNQGLITDQSRGITTSSARREAPSTVFGILTPGPVIDSTANPDNIRRKGGSSFIMDDGDGSEYIQLETKTGAQIKLDETNGYVYVINRDGTAWIQMDQHGNIDIFGATNISMRAQQDFNIRADRNINIEAGQNIYMKAAKDTINSTTTFTYDINNIPNTQTIPYYQYVGEGAGLGGNIVVQALNNVHQTVQKNMYLTVKENNLSIQVQENIDVTTVAGEQDYNSAQNINMQTNQEFNLKATGNIMKQTNGNYNLTAQSNISLESQTTINLIATTAITETAPLISLEGEVIITGDVITSGNITGGAGSTPGSTTATFNSNLVLLNDLTVAGNTQINGSLVVSQSVSAELFNSNTAGSVIPVPPIVPVTPSPPVTPVSPVIPTPAGSAATATPAEIKPLVEKINILATWAGTPVPKVKRNAEALNTTVSTLPTYEPCPEHEQFSFKSITGYIPSKTQGQQTYEGSGGAGNIVATSPPTNTDPGANNIDIPPTPANESALTKDFNMDAYECQLKIHEGVKYTSYIDSVNLPTGGIGHLLRTNELPEYPVPTLISPDQVDQWFQNDAPISIAGAQRLLTSDVWADLSDIRKRACADLCYNLGETRFSQFKQFLNYMKVGDYTSAGNSLRNSRWFTQVGRRGPNIITMIIQNVDPNGCDQKFPV